MKLINKHYETNAYFSVVAIPTTEVEMKLLHELKYGLVSDKTEICNWHPEWLEKATAVMYANALGYSNVIYNGVDEYMEVNNAPKWGDYKVTSIPSNLECLIAGYRLLGKHRKVSRILKKVRALGIEDQVSNIVPGRQ